VSYRRRTSMSYAGRRRWSPPRYGLCPRCERELMEKLKKKGLKPPKLKPDLKREPPEWTEIRPPPRSSGGSKETEEKETEGSPPPSPRSGGSKKKEKKTGPLDVTPEDVEKARSGSSEINEEFEKAQRIKVDKTTPKFKPVIGAGPASNYRDQTFIRGMRTALKDWKAGYVETPQKSGSRLKVKQYVKTKGRYPFVKRTRKSAKGRKILFVADFSGSVKPFQEEYKKALVSALEVLDSIGVKTALFGFGGERSGVQNFFFKIKKFEDPKWTVNHASKVAALEADGFTPTAEAYEGLEKYIRMHRPDLVVTLTDGDPDSRAATKRMVKQLKRYTRMVAFGIGESREDAKDMEERLKLMEYDKTFAISTGEMSKLPKKLVDLIAPT